MASSKNPAVRRIYADIRELQRDPSPNYVAAPFEDNLFEWHFTLRGPPATPFEGGVYHGRILLPSEYPFKPPNMVFLTPNGRFEVGTKICLSISAHHPEHWQPAWGLRLILEALISFFPTEAAGALGGLDWTPQERVKLARASLDYRCPKCGLVRDLLPPPPPPSAAPPSGAATGPSGGTAGQSNQYAEQIKELHFAKAAANGSGSGGSGSSVARGSAVESEGTAAVSELRGRSGAEAAAAVAGAEVTSGAPPEDERCALRAGDAPEGALGAAAVAPSSSRSSSARHAEPKEPVDVLLCVAAALLAAIAVIVFKKVLRNAGWIDL